MSDVYTDGTQWANLLATGYDKYLEYQLRSMPIFRQFVDKHVQTTLDAATHIIGVNGGVIKTDASSFAEASVAGTDVITSAVVRDANALLRRRNANGFGGGYNYAALIHPDVAVDIKSD